MKLIFQLKADERKWPVHLSDVLGEELAKTCSYEVDATAKKHWARVMILNFRNNKSLLDKLAKNDNLISGYLIDNKVIVQNLKA